MHIRALCRGFQTVREAYGVYTLHWEQGRNQVQAIGPRFTNDGFVAISCAKVNLVQPQSPSFGLG